MADVTARRAEAAATNGAGPAKASSDKRSRPVAPPDPWSVRVRLAATSSGVGDPTLLVSPLPESPGPDDGTVLAQRHGLVAGDTGTVAILSLDPVRHRLTAGGETTDLVVEPPYPGARGVTVREVLVDGFRFDVEAEPERLASLRERATRDRVGAGHAGPTEIHAIIPGRVVEVWVAPGDTVTAGERVLAIEAMKMQNELLVPRDGTIARIGTAVGETVEIGDLLIVIE
jgi:biotin carboxyl carrier protein